MIIVDSHCHLDMLTQYDDIDSIVKRANENGVKYLQTICTKLDNFENVLNIAKKYDNVFASVGVHPSEVEGVIDSDELIKLSKDDKVIGLGETGLDYFYNKEASHHKIQQDSFEQHIVASQNNNLPVIIHTRDAEGDTTDIISRNKKYKEFAGLIHCFTATEELANEVMKLGFFISISGIITFKNAKVLRDIVKKIPLERLLVETDAPYLTPEPMRGKRNEPAHVIHTANYLADMLNMDPKELYTATTKNFFNLFTKAELVK